MDISALEPLVGEWATEIKHPSQEKPIPGRVTFEWLDGGGYLVQRSTTEDARFPRGVMVLGPDAGGERIVQHYFDSRGVARVYDIDLADGVLRLWRDGAGDDFGQRYEGRFGDDGTTIEGAWERCDDGATWVHDFELNFTKLA